MVSTDYTTNTVTLPSDNQLTCLSELGKTLIDARHRPYHNDTSSEIRSSDSIMLEQLAYKVDALTNTVSTLMYTNDNFYRDMLMKNHDIDNKLINIMANSSLNYNILSQVDEIKNSVNTLSTKLNTIIDYLGIQEPLED